MTDRTRTRVEAPAKLTLSLRVTGLRDDGYHLIDAEMVSLQLCDILTITDSEMSTLSNSGDFSTGLSTGADNLVMRALTLAGRTAHVELRKNIPHGGGLGGGSTDAAAVLRWAQFNDLRSAANIGADIPFCMLGGRALVTGIGETIDTLPYEHHDITLIIPPIHISTPAVYRMWDHMGGPRGESGNDLEPAALAVEPALAEWKERITRVCGTSPTLAGSGATWFVQGHHNSLKQATHDALNNATVVFTSTREDAGSIAVEP
jgi:4-diphosphocytidyl-2-C-methyl-D-erythritol kinase